MSQPTPAAPDDDAQTFDLIAQRFEPLRDQLQRVIVGQDEVVQALIIAVLCESHVLIVGVPGLAKTLLVRTLARTLDLKFHRIQFTPDMMPSDILGTELIQEDPATGQRSLKFVPGPVFANLILADEINRTPPKTQAALLEAMGEQQITTAGRTLTLDRPFLVVATQNPIEQEGTYPLPEAQLDRFIFSLWMDYPTADQELRIVTDAPRISAEAVAPVMDQGLLQRCARVIHLMPVSQHVARYAVSLTRATRPTDPSAPPPTRQYVDWGAGPRASLHLVLAAKALAAVQGQPTPACEHVRHVAPWVLRHRIVVNYAATGEGLTAKHILDQVIRDTPEPDPA